MVVDSRLAELQLIISHSLLLFNHYAAMAASEHVVDVADEKRDARGERCQLSCAMSLSIQLISSPAAFQRELIRLVTSRNEVEIAKTIENALKDELASPCQSQVVTMHSL